MQESISVSEASGIVSGIEQRFKKEYPGLEVVHREKKDKKTESGFSIDCHGNRRMTIDARALDGIPEDGEISTLDIMHIVLGLHHEEGHLLQYRDKFADSSPTYKRMSVEALLARCMPEYGAAIYWNSIVEMDAEHHGLFRTKKLFEDKYGFPERGIKEPVSSGGEMPVDDWLGKLIDRENKWYCSRPVGSGSRAIRALFNQMKQPVCDYPPDTSIWGIKIDMTPQKSRLFKQYSQSDMWRGVHSNAELKAAYDVRRDDGNNRKRQQDLLMKYVREHPCRDILLFPNLLSYFKGVDLDHLPELAFGARVQARGRDGMSVHADLAVEYGDPGDA